MEHYTIYDKLSAILITGVYGTFGSLVHYFYILVKDGKESFKWSRFFINGFLGFFVGQVMGSFIPRDFSYRDGTLLLSGFLVYQILNLIESKGASLLFRKIAVSLDSTNIKE